MFRSSLKAQKGGIAILTSMGFAAGVAGNISGSLAKIAGQRVSSFLPILATLVVLASLLLLVAWRAEYLFAQSFPPSWTFEDSTHQGWKHSGPAANGLVNTTTQAYEGTHGLRLDLSNAKSLNPGRAHVAAPTDLAPGDVIEAWVLAPSTGPKAVLFVQDKNWKWYETAFTRLPAGTWTNLQLTVPSSAIAPLKRLGVQFTASAAWNGSVYIDAVGYGSAGSSSPTPTPSPTPTLGTLPVPSE